jgi:N-acetyl-gamma-glutamyl-phosphate reductase
MIHVGIIGGGGYTGGELLRLLSAHPGVRIGFVQSSSQAGKSISAVHEDLFHLGDLFFAANPSLETEVIFLCMSHGKSSGFMREQPIPAGVKCIDLGNDFRLDPSFIYGLPELNRESIRRAQRIANPGCFASAIQLALLPFAAAGLLNHTIHIHAITGSTGAGQALSETTHFSWRSSNISVYKAFDHQHIPEILRSLKQLQPDFNQEVRFVPIRGDFTRGILASIYFESELAQEELNQLFHSYYDQEPFTRVTPLNPHLKMVVNTNFCVIQVKKQGTCVHLISVLDNLLKGASGQAVQNMNLMFDYPEMTGLNLKAAAF